MQVVASEDDATTLSSMLSAYVPEVSLIGEEDLLADPVVIHHDHPELLVGVRHQTPLAIGVGDGETFIASSIAAFLSETRRVIFPDDGVVVAITPDGPRLFTDEGTTRAF